MVNEVVDGTLLALADPTRRAIVDLLRERPRRPGELAAAFPVSAPAISRHLRVLRRNGLIGERSLDDDLRGRVYHLRPERFEELQRWLDHVNAFWSERLDAFKEHVDGGAGQESNGIQEQGRTGP